VTLHPPRTDFGEFDLFGDIVDVGLQRLQQLPRLRRVGALDHTRHHRTIGGKALAAASAAATWPGHDPVAY